MKRNPQSFLIVALLTTAGLIGLPLLHGQAAAKQRGVLSKDAATEPKQVGPYYALVIGNNEYRNMDRLQTAVNDAKEVSQLLRDRFGFKTQVLYNATRAQILEAIDSYRALPADSNLLLYYAGHGHRDKDANRAYWLPIDAERDQRPNWINSTDITDGIHAIKSRHVLIISDSCFSGDLVLRDARAAIASGGHNAIVAKALNLNSRHVMASGGDEPVADNGTGGHSVFAAALLESFNDTQEDVFRGNDLFDKVKLRVEMRSLAKQTPRYDILRDSFADLGDFVFFRSAKISSISAAEMVIEAKRYYEAKQYDRALPLLRSAAQAGAAGAATYLGLMYLYGQGGLDRDNMQALTWFRKAAEGGDARGMNALGFMYEDGLGSLPKDDVQAVSWYRKAADAGDPRGMSNLGEMYEKGGGGLAKDDAQALSWYRKAAVAGNPTGMFKLGVMFEAGLGGLAKDDVQALSWYRKAAEAGDPTGMNSLGVMYAKGLGGLAKDDAQAVIWYRKAADAGDPTGMNNLGVIYETGRGRLAKDDAQAVIWYRKAADAGNPTGMYNLGRMYASGRGGLAKDDTQAVSWYRKAADLGNEFAEEALKRLQH